MIKQTWNIGVEERIRILQLHENATERLYLINEQWIKDSKPNPRSKEPLSINPATLDNGEGNLPNMGEIPKNIQFGFPLKKFGVPGSLTCVTDDKGNVFCNWKGDWYKLPTIQEIGQPKFVPEDNQFLYGVEEWEWLNDFNYAILRKTTQDPSSYVPAYDKNSLSLHFLKYTLGAVKRPKGRQQATEFIQADDNKYIEEDGYYFIVIGTDIPVGGRIPVPSEPKKPEIVPTPPKEIPVELNISNPFNFDQVTLTSEGQAEFDKFVESLKKYINYFSGNVEVITSASIDAEPKSKAEYNMKLSERRADAIIQELQKRLGETKLNFIAKPLGQTDQFAPGLKWPEEKDVNKTAPNRRLIIKLPKINVKVD